MKKNEVLGFPNGLNKLFNARSIAVVGASRNPGKVGHIVLNSILEGGFTGTIFPINPQENEILGLRTYPSINVIPKKIDLIVLAIPAPYVPQVMQEAIDKCVGGALILSGGFREAGRVDLENQLADLVRRCGLRIIGPNSQGFNYLPNKLFASFWFPPVLPGPMSIISQSGTVAATLAGWASNDHFGVSATVCLGNQVDVSEADTINFFVNDSATRAIACYLEGAKDGRHFLEVIKNVALKKPVVILKSGRTCGGQRASASHTQSLSGRDEVFDGFCRQFSVTRAIDIEALYDSTKALSALIRPRGNRIFIVTSSGGAAILAVDQAEQCGLTLPPLQQEIIGELKTLDLPRNTVFANPLDLTFTNATHFASTLSVLNRYDVADLYLVIIGDPIVGIADVIKSFSSSSHACVMVVFLGGGEVEKAEGPCMQEAGIPVFPTPERAVRAISSVIHWTKRSTSF